ncbi:MAG: PD-(D/E)XK nuclease family protein, partial [Desulfovibrio sp.]|nr:PD-(D/E)XK nuclease family protein [Desulfovibrio sp.]
DLLPGKSQPDIFLPDNLRPVLGLPTVEAKTMRSEYNLFRLCMTSQDVVFYWQEGVSLQGLGKKIRSRFVEQFLWEDEQRLGRILGPNDAPMESARAILSPSKPERKRIERTSAIEKRLHEILQYAISATMLDSYLSCPARFLWERILKLSYVDERPERETSLLIGRCVHGILQTLLTPYIGKEVHAACIDAATLQKALDEGLAWEKMTELSSLSFYMVRQASKSLLGKYLENLPRSTVLELEKEIRCERLLDFGKTCLLTGIVDRIDRRDNELIIIDYKTGILQLPEADLWTDTVLFSDLEDVVAGKKTNEEAARLLDELRPRLLSVQLPFYLVLTEKYCTDTYDTSPTNACLVQLAKDGKERLLFGEKSNLSFSDRHRYCKALLDFLLFSLLHAEHFDPVPGSHCTYCPYASLCLVS